MGDSQRAPLAEAIRLMSNATQAYLDGPVAHLRDAADRAARPTYDANTAAQDAASFYLHLGRAWWGGFNAVVDATAILASSPGDSHCFEIELPTVAVASTVRVVSRTWTWVFEPEPPGVTIDVMPPVVRPAGTAETWLRVMPKVGEPSWQVVLEITPLGSGPVITVVALLDANTERSGIP